jgi:hypothetical protein
LQKILDREELLDIKQRINKASGLKHLECQQYQSASQSEAFYSPCKFDPAVLDKLCDEAKFT